MIEKKVFACLTKEELKLFIAIIGGLTAVTLTLSLALMAAGKIKGNDFASGTIIGASCTLGLGALGALSKKFGLFSSEDCHESSNLIKDSLTISDYKSLN